MQEEQVMQRFRRGRCQCRLRPSQWLVVTPRVGSLQKEFRTLLLHVLRVVQPARLCVVRRERGERGCERALRVGRRREACRDHRNSDSDRRDLREKEVRNMSVCVHLSHGKGWQA